MSEYSFAYPRIGRRTCANRCVFLCGLYADFRELAANLCGHRGLSRTRRGLSADLRTFANSRELARTRRGLSRTRRGLGRGLSRTRVYPSANSRISAANPRELAANPRESVEGLCISTPSRAARPLASPAPGPDGLQFGRQQVDQPWSTTTSGELSSAGFVCLLHDI